jgi:hypothetical protein
MSARAATLLALGFLVAASVSRAQDATATESPPAVPQAGNPGAVVDMDTVVVSGVQPGPGLWRVSKGDHVLYILGTQSPLPRDMTWRADELRQVLGEAGAVLGPPGVTIGADIGFFRGLTLMPSALKAMKNPDGATLDEVLPADLYQRGSVLRRRYLGRDRGVEKKRPLIAVYELYRAALEHNGLKQGGVVGPVIDQVLKPRGQDDFDPARSEDRRSARLLPTSARKGWARGISSASAAPSTSSSATCRGSPRAQCLGDR